MASKTQNTPSGTLFTTSSLKATTYDVICIGSGWATRPIGARIVAAGYTALIVEDDLVGGDCPYYACVPSKALLRPSEALEAARAVSGAKQQISKPMVDVQAVFQRRNTWASNWDDTKVLVPMTLGAGTDLLRGTGKLAGPKQVAVTSPDGQKVDLTARHAVVLGTGSFPKLPPVPGLAEAKPWTPKEATRSSTVPDHLVIVGAGAVGCEMATAYASFGSKITVISSTPEILPKLDPEAGALVRQSLEAHGLQFLLGTKISRVERREDGSVHVATSAGDEFDASEILIAAGRAARTEGCGLESLGIPIDGMPLPVDESLRVRAVPGNWLFAVGDVNGRAPLTHMCKYHGRIAANAILAQIKGEPIAAPRPWDRVSATADHYAIPTAVFTQPAVVHVGLTRTMAEKQARAVRVIRTPSSTVGALIHSDSFGEGWAQWVVEADTEKLLGMTVVGQDVTELIHPATVAIAGGLTLSQLAHAVPCFPTMSEVFLNLADAAGV